VLVARLTSTIDRLAALAATVPFAFRPVRINKT
jgi:hypothetical protein